MRRARSGGRRVPSSAVARPWRRPSWGCPSEGRLPGGSQQPPGDPTSCRPGFVGAPDDRERGENGQRRHPALPAVVSTDLVTDGMRSGNDVGAGSGARAVSPDIPEHLARRQSSPLDGPSDRGGARAGLSLARSEPGWRSASPPLARSQWRWRQPGLPRLRWPDSNRGGSGRLGASGDAEGDPRLQIGQRCPPLAARAELSSRSQDLASCLRRLALAVAGRAQRHPQSRMARTRAPRHRSREGRCSQAEHRRGRHRERGTQHALVRLHTRRFVACSACDDEPGY